MVATDLQKQVELEAQEIANAPRVEPVPNLAVRCHWCGQLARSIALVEVVNGQERWKGDCCGN